MAKQFNVPGVPGGFVRVSYGSGKPSNLNVQGGIGSLVIANVNRRLA